MVKWVSYCNFWNKTLLLLDLVKNCSFLLRNCLRLSLFLVVVVNSLSRLQQVSLSVLTEFVDNIFIYRTGNIILRLQNCNGPCDFGRSMFFDVALYRKNFVNTESSMVMKRMLLVLFILMFVGSLTVQTGLVSRLKKYFGWEDNNQQQHQH